MVFGAAIILVALSFVGAVELSERSYNIKKTMERNRKAGKSVLKSKKTCKRRLDASTVLLLMVCAGTMLIYASYG